MHTESYLRHGHTVYEHRLDVPLDHLCPINEDNPTIQVFAHEVVRKSREGAPYTMFPQRGPDYPSPRFGTFAGGWMNRFLQDYRTMLLGQRDTGQSTRTDTQTLPHLDTDEEKAAYLRHFRQDQIMHDAEALRHELCGDDPWTTLGQSFGGFITTSYLSLAPQGLRANLITGSLPGFVHVDDIHRLTYEHTAARNRVYFQRHPSDERTVRELCVHLADTEETLPTGGRLSPARPRMISMVLGGRGNTNQLHYLLEGPWTSVRGQHKLSLQFLVAIGSQVDVAPIYSVLQEYVYACATPDLVGTTTGWTVDRLAEEIPGFTKDADPLDRSEPLYLTGEHLVYRVFDEDPGPMPLRGVAEALASTTETAPVYLPDVLVENMVPVAAAMYYDNMFVPRELSVKTGELIGAYCYITNEYQYDGSAYSGGKVVSRLLDLLADWPARSRLKGLAMATSVSCSCPCAGSVDSTRVAGFATGVSATVAWYVLPDYVCSRPLRSLVEAGPLGALGWSMVAQLPRPSEFPPYDDEDVDYSKSSPVVGEGPLKGITEADPAGLAVLASAALGSAMITAGVER